MSSVHPIRLDKSEARPFPRKDWFLLPLISLITIFCGWSLIESLARHMFTEFDKGLEQCRVFRDPASGKNRLANCVYWEKGLESDPTEYRMNRSGFRSNEDFGPKPPGVYRIVIVGSSFGFGEGTAVEKTIAGLLPAELSKQTGKKVEIYNEAIPGPPGLPQNVVLRFNDALSANPDLVLWIMTRWDVKEARTSMADIGAENIPASVPRSNWSRLRQDVASRSFRNAALDLGTELRGCLAAMKGPLAASRSAFLLQHFLDESQSQYVKYSLSGPDEIVGYLKAEPSSAWQDRLKTLDGYQVDAAGQAKRAGVPLAVVVVPTRVQAAMISMGTWPASYDPYKLDDEVRSIVESHGGVYLEIAPSFRTIPEPDKLYFPEDGHPNTRGNAVIAHLLSVALTNGAIPPLNPGQQPQLVTGHRSLP
jgi:hypothetical protein